MTIARVYQRPIMAQICTYEVFNMAYQKERKPLWKLKTWSYKRCSRCKKNTKYRDVLDLYLLKDNSAIWICAYCQHSETVQIESLLDHNYSQ